MEAMRQIRSILFVAILTGAIFSIARADSPPIAGAAVQVSGVTCDALTSWPLYSQVTVSEYPDETTWTDPVTGAYSIDLPEGTTLTLTFDAWVDGYVAATRVVPPLSATRTLDVGIFADIGSLDAPGYADYSSRIYCMEENFDSSDGGFVRDATTSPTWEWGTPSTWPSSATSSPTCWGTNLNGDYANYDNAHLLSPVYDLSTRTAPLAVVWSQAYHVEGSKYDQACAECRIGTGDWQTMWEHSGSTTQKTWHQQGFDISDAVGSTVQFRFRLVTDNSVTYPGYYIDNLRFASSAVAPDGGLMVGNVAGTDAGPLVGATVSHTSGTATAMAMPDDPNVDDGFYTLYSPAGPQNATADILYYTSETASLTVPSGGTVRQDFLLTRPPWYTLSGIAQDPLTGWPLYAQVVCTADGFPTTSTWSNPFTGEYSISLTSMGDWTVTASAWLNGYDGRSDAIGYLSADTSLTLNLTPTIDAPGYAEAADITNEDFEGASFPPAGWIAYDADGGNTAWAISTSYAHNSPQSAYHAFDGNANQDGWLIAPPTTLTAVNSTVTFWEYTRWADYYGKQSMWITTGTYSTPPTGWVEVAEFDNPVSSWRQRSVDLSTFTAQTVWFAFRYEGTDATNWYIDDVEQSYALTPPNGGLVGGFVTDADTSQPINGATVQIGNEQAQTTATPNDPAAGDGFYTLYSPAGSHTATADIVYYYPETTTPTALAGDIVRQDFALAPAPDYTVSGIAQDPLTGWPLYTLVTCSATGYPTTSTWSNPFTGEYSFALSGTGDWTVAASSWLAGYNDAIYSIGSPPADINLNLNLAPTANAPGYTSAVGTLSEGFEGGAVPPNGWATYDGDSGNANWTSSTTYVHSGSWSAAHMSDASEYQDGWLITPPTSVTASVSVASFWEYSENPADYVKQSMWIKTGAYSAPPTGWTEIAEFGGPVAQWRRQTVGLSAYAGQTVWIAFRYEGQDATNWYIDDLEIGALSPPDGGLVGGFVTDADTSLPINGATVETGSEQTQTVATPNDGAVGDGFYTLYSPAGAQSVVADIPYYYSQTATPTVPAGDIVRQDFSLTPAGNYTLSGTVRDALTGWPLYAEVECSADGYTAVSTWSDPFTGTYSLSLAATGDWNITGSTWIGGYGDTSQNLGPLSANTNFPLNLIPTVGAPGYTTTTYMLSESFEGDLFVPDGWTLNSTDGDSTQWSSFTLTAHSGSRSAVHQSDAGTYQDDWLISPPLPLTSPNATLSFWEITASADDYVKHSVWVKTGTSDWSELVELDRPTGAWRKQLVDLSSYGGQIVYLAFRYEGQGATDWYIDEIEVSNFSAPTGGLVGGFVSDALTSEYLTGATVTIRDQQMQTAPTPNDADVPDGLYFLYAPAGDSPSTATLRAYSPSSTTVSAIAGETTRQDYALDAGRLEVSPDSLQVYVLPGNATTRTLILTNTGTGALDFSIAEINQGATSLTLAAPASSSPPPARMESPVRTIDYAEKGVAKGTPPRNAIVSGGPAPGAVGAAWETMTALPSARVFNAVVADVNGYIYVMGGASNAGATVATNTNYRYDTATDTWQEMTPIPTTLYSIDAIEIDNRIFIPGDENTATTYVYDIASDTWSTIATNNGYTARSQYQVLAIGSDLYVLGGIVASASASTTQVWILDTVSGIWSAGVPMQKSRTSFSAAAINGNIYVAGGVYYPNWVPDMTAEKFDGASWSYIASLPDGGGAYTRWSYNADGLGEDGLWLAAGRRDTSWDVLNHAACYDPDTDTWTDSPTVPTLSQSRVYMEGAVAMDGYFYVIGGRDSSGSTIYATNERLQVGYGRESEVPWLSVDRTSGTLAAGESLTLTATMDSAGLGLGEYRASLRLKAATPYAKPTVSVTMIVSEQGQLQVNISPAEAVSGGAQWRLEGENDLQWSDSGDIRTDVPISSRTVEFKDVTGWGTPASQVVYITTGSLATANATYERRTFALRYLAAAGGTVSEPASQTVAYGQNGTAVTAVANEGYYFTQWSDGSTDNPRQDIDVTQDIAVTAQFARYTYQLTYIAGEHGTIDGETSRTFVVFHGNEGTTVTAVPEPGYWFIRWSDDSTVNPRIDTGVTSSVIVTAIFEPPASGIATSQTCSVYSDGHVYAGLYNYSTGGGWVTWLDSEGGGQLVYDLPRDQWLGFYLYDYTSGQWTRALYALKN